MRRIDRRHLRITGPPAGDRLLILFRLPLLLLVGVTIYGVVGYRVVEGWSLLDALYMTVITLATVGFREVQPLGPTGQAFTISLILAGILVAAWPKYGALVVAAWLAAIIVDLLILGNFYDVALRDFGLLVGAVALSRLAAHRPPGSVTDLRRPSSRKADR